MAIYSLSRRRVIALLILTSILLITLDIRGSAAIDRLRSGFAYILQPFDTAARAVSRPVVNAWRGIRDYDELVKENELLREQIANDRGAAIEAQAAIMQYQELLQVNRLVGLTYPKVTAQVQGQSPSNFQFTVEISKGSNDGIRVGMPVVNGAGLVGKITETFPNSSIVMLITDPEFSIGATILSSRPAPTASTTPEAESTLPGGVVDPSQTTTTTTDPTATSTTEGPDTGTTTTTIDPTAPTTTGLLSDESPDDTGGATTSTTLPGETTTSTTTTTMPAIEVIRETGTLRGQGPGQPLVIEFIDRTTTVNEIELGSTVETAGGATGLAPAGLPIGLVSAITDQPGSPSPIIEVESAAGDLSRLTFVTVLLYLPNSSR